MALQFEGGGFEYVRGELVPIKSGDGRRSGPWGEVLGPVFLDVRANKLGRVLIDILTYAREENEKKENYRYGVPWYWIVNTVTGITAEYRAAANSYSLIYNTPFTGAFRPQLFPGLEITISE